MPNIKNTYIYPGCRSCFGCRDFWFVGRFDAYYISPWRLAYKNAHYPDFDPMEEFTLAL